MPYRLRGSVTRKKMLSIVLVLSVVVCTSLPGCRILFNDMVPRQEIFSYVNENYQILEAFPYEDMPKPELIDPADIGTQDTSSTWNTQDLDQRQRDFIKEHLGSNTIVQEVFAHDENILEFYCGGSGLSTGSTYVGFYYSKDGTPSGLGFDHYGLIEIEPGIFECQNEDGSHKTRSEKIRDNWYYYLMDYY